MHHLEKIPESDMQIRKGCEWWDYTSKTVSSVSGSQSPAQPVSHPALAVSHAGVKVSREPTTERQTEMSAKSEITSLSLCAFKVTAGWNSPLTHDDSSSAILLFSTIEYIPQGLLPMALWDQNTILFMAWRTNADMNNAQTLGNGMMKTLMVVQPIDWTELNITNGSSLLHTISLDNTSCRKCPHHQIYNNLSITKKIYA